MDTAIVILNWNGKPWLERFLPDVVAHSQDVRVIVADNGSTDGSKEFVERHHPEVLFLSGEGNLGFAGGYNRALAQLDDEYFVLLNSDVHVGPGWLPPLRRTLDNNPDMAAVQPKVLSFAHPDKFEHAGAAGGFMDRNGYPFCRGRIFELTEKDTGQYDVESDVFWATGACLMIRAEAFREAGGFDDALFAHMEEIDLCWRLRRLGWRIGYTPDSVVHHVGGGSLGYGSPRKTYLNFRNSLIVLTKNLRNTNLFLRIVRRLVLDGFAALKFLFEGHAGHAWQVVRAHWSYFVRSPKVLRQRRELMATEQRVDLTGMYMRSVAYDRFILGIRHFSELDETAFMQRDAAGVPRQGDSHPAQSP